MTASPPRLRALAVLAVAGLAVAAGACGSDSSSSSSDTTAATTPAATTPAATTTATTTPAAGNKVAVVLKEFTLVPAPTSAKAGEVTFVIANKGNVDHEFVVIKTPKQAGDLLKGDEADETGTVGEDGNVPSGQTNTLKLKLTAGHYALICNLPGHYKAGQYANFNVS